MVGEANPPSSRQGRPCHVCETNICSAFKADIDRIKPLFVDLDERGCLPLLEEIVSQKRFLQLPQVDLQGSEQSEASPQRCHVAYLDDVRDGVDVVAVRVWRGEIRAAAIERRPQPADARC